MTASLPRYSKDETARRSQEIYDKDVRPAVEEAHQVSKRRIKTTIPPQKIS